MRSLHIKALIAAVVFALALLLGATLALADNPDKPTSPPGAPSKPGGHAYYEVAEVKYSLHNTRLQDCLLCHSWDGTPHPTWGLNPYGLDLLDALDEVMDGMLDSVALPAGELTNAANYTTDAHTIWDAFDLIADEDSDGDNAVDPGHAWRFNEWELLNLTFPGDELDYLSEEPSEAGSGPHGGYGDLPDKCAACHRVHTAQAPMLLSADEYDMCTACHDGTGAATNVVDGRSNSDGLKGGGFVTALMDTSLDGVMDGPDATSTHTVDGTAATMWGWGAAGSGAGDTDVSLGCGSCHNPHNPAWSPDGGTTIINQYRMLQASPGPASMSRGFHLSIPDEEGTHQYVQEYEGVTNRPITTYQPNDRIGEFCSLCHTRYMANSIGYATVEDTPREGDDIFTYQHATKEATCSTGRCHSGSSFSRPRCLDCHVSHGTVASMATNSSIVPWPGDVSPGGSNQPDEGDSRSSLLRLDNRGVCTACHEK